MQYIEGTYQTVTLLGHGIDVKAGVFQRLYFEPDGGSGDLQMFGQLGAGNEKHLWHP